HAFHRPGTPVLDEPRLYRTAVHRSYRPSGSVGRSDHAIRRVFDYPENGPDKGLGGNVNFGIAMALLGALLFFLFFALMVALFRRNVDVVDRVQKGRAAAVVKDWMAYLRSVESIFKPLGEFIPRSAEEMSRQEK